MRVAAEAQRLRSRELTLLHMWVNGGRRNKNGLRILMFGLARSPSASVDPEDRGGVQGCFPPAMS